ncbi:hypothetical protein AX16_007436 [Volvariella volvacea WC 439]|nr:hypothetical protein AX16_007436 [Volvariella volvacea WC 439]
MSDDSNNNNSSNSGSGGRTLGGGSSEPLPTSWNRPAAQPRFGRIGDWSGSSSSGGGGSGGRFGTLGGGGSSRGGGFGPGDDDDDDDSPQQGDQGESWFAGGERSGISVQNPDRQRSVPGGDMVRDLLRRAAQAGPPPPGHEQASASRPRQTAFTGGGHTLGSDEVPSTYIPDPRQPSVSEAPEETAVRHITFWRDGFSVEDGELMRYDDPNHAQVLAEINAGRAPPSVLNVLPGQPVELRVAQRTEENYIPPKKKAFSGSGNRLGAPVPEVVQISQAMPGAFPAPGSSSDAGPSREREGVTTKFEVDQSLPTTSVQIRLADGTRMVARMNLMHTVRDIRNFINASRPENLTRPYTIGTTFPNRTLDDDTVTIEAAGLKNSVIVQRWV